MGLGRRWTKEEDNYLAEQWGTLSVEVLARRLNRTENSINVRKNMLGLGAFLESGDYITWNQLHKALGRGNSNSYKGISWIKNRNFPIHYKKIHNCSFKIVYLDEWWKWAEKNKEILDFSKFEKNSLGKEPEWVNDKRKHDFEKNRKYKKTPWTKDEDNKLKRLLMKHKYSYKEMSEIMGRTEGAVTRRMVYLGIKERPVRDGNHTKWTEKEKELLGEMIKAGKGYENISSSLGRSTNSVRGRVYAMYLTEDLDKVREIMGDGNFGDNRTERSLKQWNAMDTRERIETREAVTKLAAVLQYRLREEMNKTEWGHYFQKDMCVNFCGECLKTEGCDVCDNFKKAEPQNCKMCGKTFYEKKSHLYCFTCRDMRKRQWLKKRFILNG